MINEKYIMQAVVADIFGHPDAEKFKQRALAGSLEDSIAATRAMANCMASLTSDIFSVTDDSGKLLVDASAVWKNFDKIVGALETCGVRLSYDDFLRPLTQREGKKLLDIVIEHEAVDKVFSFRVWHGRFDEMQRLWFCLPPKTRNEIKKKQGAESMQVKRQLLKAEGRIVPEDKLAKAGLTPADVRAAFGQDGDLAGLEAKLRAVGDFLRKEYVLMPDNDGNSVFDSRKDAWNHYDTFVRMMKNNGEHFEVADFVCKYAYAKNILARAAEHNALNKIFNPEHWQGRLEAMHQLWGSVSDGWKGESMTARDFENAYAEAESLTYMPRFMRLSARNKKTLLSPLNPDSRDGKPVLPLGLKAVWEKMDSICKALADANEKLTVEDLNLRSGIRGDTCMFAAARYGCFDKVIAICESGGSPLKMEDFLSKDASGTTLLNVLADRNQLSLAFAPQLWAGRIREMQQLWSCVAPAHRTQIDYARAEIMARQETLKTKRKGGIRFKNPRGPS